MTKLEVVDFGVRAETKLEKARRLGRPIDMWIPSGQDSAAINLEHTVFAIADGVASDANAAFAANNVTHEFIDAFSDHYSSYLDVRTVIQSGLLDRLHKTPALIRATTTLTGVVMSDDNYVSYLHLGDTQLLMRRCDEITEITSEQVVRGHSLLNYLGISSSWPPGHERHPLALHPQPNQPSHSGKEAEWGSLPLALGDRLVLATDGVIGSEQGERKSKQQWLEQTRYALGAQAVADMLVRMSPKIDDSTAMVIDVG